MPRLPNFVIENAEEKAIFTIDGPPCLDHDVSNPRDIEFWVIAIFIICYYYFV